MFFLRKKLSFVFFTFIFFVAQLLFATAFGMQRHADQSANQDGLIEVPVVPAAQQQNIYRLIAQENTKSLNSADTTVTYNQLHDEYEKNGYKGLIKSQFAPQMHPNEDSQQRLILKLLSDFYDKNPSTQSTIMDEVTWQDLNILCGSKSSPRTHLASIITKGRAVTAIGTATVLRMLVQPSAQISNLRAQQEVTKELVKDEQFFNDLDAKLKELVIPENILLSFWNSGDFFRTQLEVRKKKIPLDDKIAFLKRVSEWVNKSPWTLEIYDKTIAMLGLVPKALMVAGTVALPVYLVSGYNILPWIAADKLSTISPFTILGVVNLANQAYFTQNVANRAQSGFAIYSYGDLAYYMVRYFDEMKTFYEIVHKKICYVVKYLNNLKTMEEFVAQHPTLTDKIPALQNFIHELNNLKTNNPDFRFLISLLESSTFKGEYTWWEFFSRVTVAYQLIREQKEHFVHAMLAVGELDAQLTIAKLYKEFQNKPVKFCFPEFLEDQKNPVLHVQDAWNPFLDPEKAIPSSIDIGCLGMPQNVIITGPNAGGKSTITKAFIFTFILGQSLGIAPAKAAAFTPASIAMTYLNITDDIAQGKSHFKAGVVRAMQLLNASKKLAPGQFCVFAVDEIFNGTTYKEGQAAAYALIEEFGKNPAVISIANTHFPLITELEKTGLFRNYKVSVIDLPGEKIVYPYKLEPGISHQNVALKILEEEGCGEDFLQRAQQFV